jgi:hypothetical protein
LLAAAQRHIRPNEMGALIVGLAEDFVGDIQDVGDLSEIDITIPDPPTKFEVPPATAASLAAGREVLAAAAAAHGAASLARATGMQIRGEGTLAMMGQAMAFSYESIRAFPGRSRTDMTIGGMFKITTVLDGETGWRQTPQGLMDLAGPDLEEARIDEVRATSYILRHWEEMEWQALEPREFDGVACQVVHAPDAAVAEWLLYFDSATHLLRGMEYRGRGRQGPVHAVERFRDYDAADGVRLPHKTTVSHDGEQILDLQLQSVQVNVEVDEEIFRRPE